LDLYTGLEVNVKNIYNDSMSVRNTLFLFCLVVALFSLPAVSHGMQKGVFISIIDGDSMMVSIEGRAREVRLIGIDAPEWGQEYGTKAKTYSLKFCYGKPLGIEYDVSKRDRFGRMLAYVYVGEKMLNEELVKSGLALAVKYNPNTKHHAQLVRAQEWAKKNRMGFWLHGGLKMTPREWRKTHRKK